MLTLIKKLFKKTKQTHVDKGENMIRNITKFEQKVGDRFYHLFCEMDSPLSEVKDVLLHFLGHVTQIENSSKEKKEECGNECIPKPE